MIRGVVARWPGSTHDSRILNESLLLDKLMEMPEKYHILGDQGYGCQNFLLTPLSNPQTPKEKRYNKAQSSTRMVVERLNGVLKRRFLCLHKELTVSPEKCCTIIIACAVLHNLARLHGDDFEEPNPDEFTPEMSSNLFWQQNTSLCAHTLEFLSQIKSYYFKNLI